MNVLFNRTSLKYGRTIAQPSHELIRNTTGLYCASIDDAAKFGGELTRAALGAVDLTHSRKHIVVDTKIHMLMPGMLPAIPGWHTDGVPRLERDKPDIKLQESLRSNIYHLLVTGFHCLTEFINTPLKMDVPSVPSPALYKEVDKRAEEIRDHLSIVSAPTCQFVTWDWWQLHRGIPAKAHEWRFLIRIAETDTIEPKTDLREVLRTQQQVYVPLNYGW